MAAVLIVEDDQQVRVLTESVLADAGHQTFSAATTQEALAIIEANAVSLDILFVDIGLALDEAAGAVHPGIDLAKQAVAIRPHLSVLYTTGQGI
jgi:DNA-binding NtrC family response regulator